MLNRHWKKKHPEWYQRRIPHATHNTRRNTFGEPVLFMLNTQDTGEGKRSKNTFHVEEMKDD